MIELLAGFATFARVFCRAIQQQNVIWGNYFFVIPVSYVMGALEIWIVTVIVVEGFSLLLVLAIGTGGWMGAVLAMYLHNKFLGKHRA